MEDLAIILTIYDGYSDMWDDCINRINKFWPSHPSIYVFTNSIKKEWGNNIQCIPVGDDAEWSRKAKLAVSTVKEKYILLLLEDFFIGEKISEMQVEELLEFIKLNKIVYAKLCDNNRIIYHHKPRFDAIHPYEIIYKDEEDAVCLQPSIWDKNHLNNLLGDENYNAWIFERI